VIRDAGSIHCRAVVLDGVGRLVEAFTIVLAVSFSIGWRGASAQRSPAGQR
jgi:hypothetical protein